MIRAQSVRSGRGGFKAAFRHRDFRWLFATRVSSQIGDGLFQAVLISAVVFDPESADTARGFATALALVYVPYSIVGPFVGVFIDRWSRRKILRFIPLLRMTTVVVLLFVMPPTGITPVSTVLILLVFSANRFFLATAGSVMPRLVPTDDLLVANSAATIGGTVSTFVGIFIGAQVAELAGTTGIVLGVAVLWGLASLASSRIRRDLTAAHLERSGLGRELRLAAADFGRGVTRLVHTPRAVWPIASITLDQFIQGYILVLSLFVFRERWLEGVGSYSWLIGAGGVGILIGILTVGRLGARIPKPRLVAIAFVTSGVALVGTSVWVNRGSVLLVAFLMGLTFTWKKVPVDTMVQEAVPDAFRGRVFSVYDVTYNMARVLSAVAATFLLDVLSIFWSLLLSGVVFLLWSPVLPWALRRAPEFQIRFRADGRADEIPLAIRRGGPEEAVTLRSDELVEAVGGARSRRLRLETESGSLLDVVRAEPDGPWRLEDEA